MCVASVTHFLFGFFEGKIIKMNDFLRMILNRLSDAIPLAIMAVVLCAIGIGVASPEERNRSFLRVGISSRYKGLLSARLYVQGSI